MVVLILLSCSSSAVQAAELLDVKPVVAGNSVSVEVTADVSMTYTYYKVPGQARAVVDIADADPEKVEPLIVVNKGAVSSISVDKAQISGMVVSRLVFNLVSETDISVKASPDRKLLTVTFGGSAGGAAPIPQPAPVQAVPEPVAQKTDAVPVKKVEPPQPAASKEEDDPLGLDEPVVSTQKKAAPVTTQAGGTPPVIRVPKLEPVVPISSRSFASSIQRIMAGGVYIDILANGPLADFKLVKLTKPERLAIDVPGVKNALSGKVVVVNKFGISKVRVGVYPEYVRIVLDASTSEFPRYTVTNIPDGLRISFK